MIQSDTLFLVDLFEIFRNMYIEIYELDLWTAGFAWQAVSKKMKSKLDLWTDMDMLLMVQKRIRGRICHSIYRYPKADNKYMIKIKKYHIFNIGMLTIYMDGQFRKNFQ